MYLIHCFFPMHIQLDIGTPVLYGSVKTLQYYTLIVNSAKNNKVNKLGNKP